MTSSSVHRVVWWRRGGGRKERLFGAQDLGQAGGGRILYSIYDFHAFVDTTLASGKERESRSTGGTRAGVLDDLGARPVTTLP